ncbi:N-acetylneuraminate synthase family protein [Sporosarcina sp. FSL W7-1349]|uniref:N-acetylneuraminate synthase family protein n=1 Tax=Sporosarcina sp. FSL W7-1349 TaxID=2921561 RepID=UPI0030F7D7A6
MNKPYLIAEAGVNHEGDIETALEMVRVAAQSGADAIKFQTYKASKIASKNSPAYWDQSKEPANSQYELFTRYDRFGEDEYKLIYNECVKNNIDFLSTPFDFEAAKYLASYMKVFKISSSDLTNKPFLEYLASFNKPILLSVGASKYSEIAEAVEILESAGCVDITLLHCVLSYPTENKDANLQFINRLKEMFPQCKIGYSDHTLPDERMLILTTAFLLGATVIEKHFTLDKTLPGNDHYHAMDSKDIKKFKENIELLNTIIDTSFKRPLDCETDARKYARRSIVVNKYLPKGSNISKSDLTFKRPGTGISPALIDEVVGRKVKEDIEEDTILTWKLI